MVYVPKLYHLCLYRCKFATVRTNVVKPNNVLYLAFSFLSLPVLTLNFFPLSSHIRPKLPSTAQQRKNKMKKMTLRSVPRRSRSSSWARPLRSDHRHRHRRRRRKRHGRGHSNHRHRHRRQRHKRHRRGHSDHRHFDRIIAIVIVVRGVSGMGQATPIIHIVIAVVIAIVIAAPISPISLSLFWWLVVLIVGGWLILVDGGRLIGLWV